MQDDSTRTLGLEVTKDELEQMWAQRMKNLLNVLARPTVCRDCGRDPIWFVTTKNGRPAPYTDEGLSHFADCPAAIQRRVDRR